MRPARAIPPILNDAWNLVRHERAVLRHHLEIEGHKFWKNFPRQRRRVMPTITYTEATTWFEPEPVTGLGWEDHLGLVMRWRISGVIRMKEAVNGKFLKATWEQDWPKDNCPTSGQLAAGKIVDPGDQENYRYFWKLLHALHGQYKFLGKWFERLSQVALERDAEWVAVYDITGDLRMRQESAVGKWKVPSAKIGNVS